MPSSDKDIVKRQPPKSPPRLAASDNSAANPAATWRPPSLTCPRRTRKERAGTQPWDELVLELEFVVFYIDKEQHTRLRGRRENHHATLRGPDLHDGCARPLIRCLEKLMRHRNGLRGQWIRLLSLRLSNALASVIDEQQRHVICASWF